jgi:hypothetical protein
MGRPVIVAFDGFGAMWMVPKEEETGLFTTTCGWAGTMPWGVMGLFIIEAS